jgi:hypothetical protein
MLTTDFTGTYDYEKEEAEHAARYILDDFIDGEITLEELPERIMKERIHWKKCLPETFDDFDKHFLTAIEAGLNK